MPIYEYQCKKCQKVIEELRSVSERDAPVTHPCIDDPSSAAVATDCQFERILSPTPTTFRFNDFNGYRGLDETRGMNGTKRRKVDKVLKQW